jgi:hypothetical protein
MQPQAETEQERWQGLLARAEAQSAQVEQEVLTARNRRQRMEQEAIQQRSERTRLEQKLTVVRTFAAVSIIERLPGMPDDAVRTREEGAFAEEMWRRVERAVKQEGGGARRAMLCETCLDHPKDVDLSCGHRACADCAELSKCYLCHQLITAPTR